MAYIGNSPANVGNYQIVDNIASGFNGSATSFAIASGGITITPAKTGQILCSINGVLQQPDDAGSHGFRISSSNIIFSSAPASGDVFWAVYQGQAVDIGLPSNNSVNTTHLANDAVTADKLANSINAAITANTAKTGISSAQTSAITANTAKTGITSAQANAITANTSKTTNATHTGDVTGSGALTIGANKVITDKIANDAVTADKLANSINSAISANTSKTTNATHSGEVTGATALTIAGNVVDEANLKISNNPTNGYVLTAQSGNTGGMTWAEMTGGGPSLGTDSIIRTNGQTINENITIGSTTNGMSAGPITIANNKTVTVNGNWSIV